MAAKKKGMRISLMTKGHKHVRKHDARLKALGKRHAKVSMNKG
jgi:hypothetical protein